MWMGVDRTDFRLRSSRPHVWFMPILGLCVAGLLVAGCGRKDASLADGGTAGEATPSLGGVEAGAEGAQPGVLRSALTMAEERPFGLPLPLEAEFVRETDEVVTYRIEGARFDVLDFFGEEDLGLLRHDFPEGGVRFAPWEEGRVEALYVLEQGAGFQLVYFRDDRPAGERDALVAQRPEGVAVEREAERAIVPLEAHAASRGVDRHREPARVDGAARFRPIAQPARAPGRGWEDLSGASAGGAASLPTSTRVMVPAGALPSLANGDEGVMPLRAGQSAPRRGETGQRRYFVPTNPSAGF